MDSLQQHEAIETHACDVTSGNAAGGSLAILVIRTCQLKQQHQPTAKVLGSCSYVIATLITKPIESFQMKDAVSDCD